MIYWSTKMKKILIAVAASVIVSATPALANTANTTIYAQVAPVCTISAPGTTAINLSGTTAVGDVTAQCNNAAGFTGSVSSLHNGHLADQNGVSATQYPYTLTLAGFGAVPLNGTTSISSAQLGGNAALINATTFAMSVNVAAPNGPAYAGTYQDTISFTLTAN
jgi:hypothetical protein